MPNLVILKLRPFEHKAKFEKRSYLFRSEIGIVDIFFKSLYAESFEDLQIIVIKNFKPVPLCPIKWQSCKIFATLRKSPLLIANIVKCVVSGLRQFLATESP